MTECSEHGHLPRWNDDENSDWTCVRCGIHTFTEYRLVRVQGEKRMCYARGSARYVEDMFAMHGAHTMPKSLTARFGKAPVRWEIQQVRVTEEVLGTTVKTDAEVEAAKRAEALRVPPEMRTYEDDAKLAATGHHPAETADEAAYYRSIQDGGKS